MMSDYFNPQRILVVCDDDLETARSICEMFIEDAPKRLVCAKKELSSNNHVEAKRNVHSIKGASINIGANKLGEIAAAMESQIGNPEYKSTHLAELSDALDKTVIAIKDWLAA